MEGKLLDLRLEEGRTGEMAHHGRTMLCPQAAARKNNLGDHNATAYSSNRIPRAGSREIVLK